MTCTYAGVPLPVPTPEVSAWVQAHISPADVLPYAPWGTGAYRWQWTCPGGEPARRPIRLGSLHWPTGASRWAQGWYLASSAQLAQIRARVYQNGTYQPQPLALGDGTRSVQTSLWLLPPRPLSGAPGGNQLWLLPLVDDRYWWWERTTGNLVPTTWRGLLTSLGAALGVSLPSDPIPAAYLVPSADLAAYYEPVPPLLDTVATNLGMRVVRALDGSVRLVGPATAQAAHQALLARVRPVTAGGALQVGPRGADLPAQTPGKVQLAFRRLQDGATQAARYAGSATLASLGLPEFAGVRPNGETRTWHERAYAAFTGTTFTDQAPLAALVSRWASDWYRWQLSPLDLVYAGVMDWAPTGLEGGVEWVYTRDQVSTRVQRPAYQDTTEELYHGGPNDPTPTAGTIIYDDITFDVNISIINYNGVVVNFVTNTSTINVSAPVTININAGQTVTVTGGGTWLFGGAYLEVCWPWAWCTGTTTTPWPTTGTPPTTLQDFPLSTLPVAPVVVVPTGGTGPVPIGGLIPQTPGQIVTLVNPGPDWLTLLPSDPGSTPAHRFGNPGGNPVHVPPGYPVQVVNDPGLPGWRPLIPPLPTQIQPPWGWAPNPVVTPPATADPLFPPGTESPPTSSQPGAPVQPLTPSGGVTLKGVRKKTRNQHMLVVNRGPGQTTWKNRGATTSTDNIRTPNLADWYAPPGFPVQITYDEDDGEWDLLGGWPVVSKGGIPVSDGTYPQGLAVGADGQVLTADSTQSLGVKWAAAGGGSSINGESVLTTAYTVTSSYADTGLSVALPSAGTYWLEAEVSGSLQVGTAAGGYLLAKLVDSTAGADVPDTPRQFCYAQVTGQDVFETTTLGRVYTVAGPATIRLYAEVIATGTITTAQILAGASLARQTCLRYFQITGPATALGSIVPGTSPVTGGTTGDLLGVSSGVVQQVVPDSTLTNSGGSLGVAPSVPFGAAMRAAFL